jgi:hypothetical protein
MQGGQRESLQLEGKFFEHLGLLHDTSAHDSWQLCQQREIVLPTTNRHNVCSRAND